MIKRACIDFKKFYTAFFIKCGGDSMSYEKNFAKKILNREDINPTHITRANTSGQKKVFFIKVVGKNIILNKKVLFRGIFNKNYKTIKKEELCRFYMIKKAFCIP